MKRLLGLQLQVCVERDSALASLVPDFFTQGNSSFSSISEVLNVIIHVLLLQLSDLCSPSPCCDLALGPVYSKESG